LEKSGKPTHRQPKAYQDSRFLQSKDARALRILAEYLEPLHRFQRHNIQDTIVFMGSARLRSEHAAKAALVKAQRAGHGIEAAEMALRLSIYYEAARELARHLTEWSKKLDRKERRFVVCTGGGPGIMEAANRGAAETKGLNIGLTISIRMKNSIIPISAGTFTSTFTISLCANSGSSTWRRRWCCSRAVMARLTSCSRS
jgi:hypothetical protein